MPFIAAPPFQPRTSFDASSSSFVEFQHRQLPEVISYAPVRGPRGTKFSVFIRSPYDLADAHTTTLQLSFGSKPCLVTMTRMDSSGQFYEYNLYADVPDLKTNWLDPAVHVTLQMLDNTGHMLGSVDVGDFYNTDDAPSQFASPQTMNKKRKNSADSMQPSREPKRAASHNTLRPKGLQNTSQYPFYQSASPFPGYHHVGQEVPGTHRSPSLAASGEGPSPRQRQGSYHMPHTNSGQANIKARSPLTPAGWSPRYVDAQVHQGSGLGIAMPKMRATPVDPANPILVRTSILSPSPSPAAAPAGLVQPGQPFNPYAMYPHKAVLKIEGNLDAMGEHWTTEEWDAKRRLVKFERSQSGSTITTRFEPVSIDNRPSNSICISCIWWEEKQEAYVTSVDTIYLLESLVAVRFTVEEKNRIRRNLEGFRPLTVSKAKADSEEFFKVIMGFPNPKPRNIEKDVKVFPWKILAHALKKIIGKYVRSSRCVGRVCDKAPLLLTSSHQSASYSSTAGALLTPTSNSGYGSVSSAAGSHPSETTLRPTASPRSISASTSTVTRTPSLTSAAYSPGPNQAGAPPQQMAGGPPDHRASVHSLGSSGYTSAPNHWPPAPSQAPAHPPPYPSPQQGYPVSAPSQRSSYDFTNYLDGSSTAVSSTMPGNSQALYYGGVLGFTTAEDIATVQRRMSHHHNTTGA